MAASSVTSDRIKEVVEAVLRAYYRHIGTPAPAPGIERLAALAVETALPLMREEWEEEALSVEVIRGAEEILSSSSRESVREVAGAIIQAMAKTREGEE